MVGLQTQDPERDSIRQNDHHESLRTKIVMHRLRTDATIKNLKDIVGYITIFSLPHNKNPLQFTGRLDSINPDVENNTKSTIQTKSS